MNRIVLSLSLLILASGTVGAAEKAAPDGWTGWSLRSRGGSTDRVKGWTLMLHPDGRVSSSWVGPMYDAEADNPYVTIEGLETLGTYSRGDGSITFRNEDFSAGWLWQWAEVTCSITQTDSSLALYDCIGKHRGDGLDADPPQPPDMEFGLQE